MKAIMNAIKSLFNWLRRLLFKPSAKIGLGLLVIIGFAGGVWFWAGFNAGMQATNTEEFCTSCHTMGDNMLPELKKTVHFKNRTGVGQSVQIVTYPMTLRLKLRVKCKPHVKYCHN